MAYQKDFRNRYELQLSLTLSVITGLDATHSAHHHPTHHHNTITKATLSKTWLEQSSKTSSYKLSSRNIDKTIKQIIKNIIIKQSAKTH